MSTALDIVADVSFTRTSAVVQSDSFGVILLVDTFLDTKITGFGRVRKYTDPADMLSDGFLATDSVYLAALAIQSQNNPPASWLVGRADSSDASMSDSLTAIDAGGYGWYILHLCGAAKTNAHLLDAAGWIEAAKRFHIFDSADTNSLTPYVAGTSNDLLAQMKGAGYSRTMGGYHSKASEFFMLSLVAACATKTPGAFAYAYKTLAGVTADSLTVTQKQNVWGRNASTYCIINANDSGRSEGSKVAIGEWGDIIVFDDWLRSYLQQDIYGYMVALDKTPLSDDGIAGLQSVIQKRMEAGADNGGLIKSSIKITVPKFSTISTADKQARKVSGIKVSAEHQQAIYFVKVAGTLEA